MNKKTNHHPAVRITSCQAQGPPLSSKADNLSHLSLDSMALAYCVAEVKEMDVKVVHDILVTTASILRNDGFSGVWAEVKRLTGSDSDNTLPKVGDKNEQ